LTHERLPVAAVGIDTADRAVVTRQPTEQNDLGEIKDR